MGHPAMGAMSDTADGTWEGLARASVTVFRRFPVTLLLSVALATVALITDTVSGPLTAGLLRRIGFAPQDLLELDLVRLFTSALITHGRLVFAGAFTLIIVGVGAAEWRAGSLVAFLAFWGIHLATLVGYSFIITPTLAAPGSRLPEILLTTRDVGPSAGYFGCMGLALGGSRRRSCHLMAALTVVWLTTALVLGIGAGPARAIFPASVAHLIAFPLGWFAGVIWQWRGGVPPETRVR